MTAFHVLSLLAGACSSEKFRASGLGGQGGAAVLSGAAGESAGATLGGSAGDLPSSSGASGAPEAEGGAPMVAGTGGTSGVAGVAGKPVVSCDCAADSYCQDGTTKCRPCLDFSRLEFGAPQKLSTLAHAPSSVERFPRPAPKASALFYSSGVSTEEERLWYSATPVSGVGAALSEPSARESGPLFAPGLVDEQNFFFDRVDLATGKRKIMMGAWSGTALSNVVLASMQLNRTGSSDYSVAIAAKVGHVYWMSTRAGEPELFYDVSALSSEEPPQVLDLSVKAGATATCPRTGEDATPWVNLEGNLLLFRNPSLDENCKPNDSGAYDLFAVPLAKDGSPITSAFPLAGLNFTGGESSETDPSLSPDACSIYFASDHENGDFDLYRAFRK